MLLTKIVIYSYSAIGEEHFWHIGCNSSWEVLLNVWSFERKTYTWSSRKSSHSMKSGRFQVKSVRFHTDFMGEIRQISYGFHPWNPPDFERPIARNGKPYVLYVAYVSCLSQAGGGRRNILFVFLFCCKFSHKRLIDEQLINSFLIVIDDTNYNYWQIVL